MSPPRRGAPVGFSAHPYHRRRMSDRPSTPDLEHENALWEMVKLATPTVASMVSFTLMQFVDGLMVTRISPADPVYLAAQGNGSVWSFAPMSIVIGMLGVVNTYVAQNLGAGTPQRGSAYAWTALWLALFAWLGALVPFALVLPSIFNGMGHEPRLVELETAYAQILLLGGFFTLASRGLSQYFYGMHRPLIVFIATVAGNLVNLGCNWVLIYGNLGAPALGVQGAAYATLIGTFVEFLIPLCVFLGPAWHARYATRAAWRPSFAHLRDILRIGWPPAMMFGNELICWAYFMTRLQGQFGPEQNSAGWIALRYMHLSFMPAVGMSFACTAIVGKCLGAGRPDLARSRARIGVGVAMAYMGLCALAFIAFRHDLVALFIPADMPTDRAEIIHSIGARIMIVAAVFQLFDALGITLVGVLRGAGDTVWPGLATVALAWTFIVGGGSAAVALAPQWGVLGPWSAAGAYIIVLGLTLAWRFRSGRWMSMKVLDKAVG